MGNNAKYKIKLIKNKNKNYFLINKFNNLKLDNNKNYYLLI